VKGSDVHKGMPCSKSSQISGWDQRKMGKSGSSLKYSFKSADLGTGDTRIHVT